MQATLRVSYKNVQIYPSGGGQSISTFGQKKTERRLVYKDNTVNRPMREAFLAIFYPEDVTLFISVSIS